MRPLYYKYLQPYSFRRLWREKSGHLSQKQRQKIDNSSAIFFRFILNINCHPIRDGSFLLQKERCIMQEYKSETLSKTSFNRSERIDITGLDKAEVLFELYNVSHIQGLGFLQAAENYTLENAREDFESSNNKYFDYLHGKVMKVNLSGNSFDPSLYDRDNGKGAAQRIIDGLKARNKEKHTERALIEESETWETPELKNKYHGFFINPTDSQKPLEGIKERDRFRDLACRIRCQSIETFCADGSDRCYTWDHCIRVARGAELLAERLHLPENEVQNIYEAALVHDIGKCEIDQSLLNKPGFLDSQERAALERHVKICENHFIQIYTMAKENGDFEKAEKYKCYIDVATEHHAYYEKDKGGYNAKSLSHMQDFSTHPPVSAQIVALADVYDSVAFRRPYQDHQFTKEEVENILKENLEKGQFNPELYEIFTREVIPVIEMERGLVERMGKSYAEFLEDAIDSQVMLDEYVKDEAIETSMENPDKQADKSDRRSEIEISTSTQSGPEEIMAEKPKYMDPPKRDLSVINNMLDAALRGEDIEIISSSKTPEKGQPIPVRQEAVR